MNKLKFNITVEDNAELDKQITELLMGKAKGLTREEMDKVKLEFSKEASRQLGIQLKSLDIKDIIRTILTRIVSDGYNMDIKQEYMRLCLSDAMMKRSMKTMDDERFEREMKSMMRLIAEERIAKLELIKESNK